MKTLIIIFTVVLVSALSSHAQSLEGCILNRTAPPAGTYSWPPNIEVRVYFMAGMFEADQKEALLQAMRDWNSAAERTGAQVHFTFAGETNEVEMCRHCLTITRQEVYRMDRKHYAFFNPIVRVNSELLSAWIVLDVATTDAKALQAFMSHELGHGMGLSDCLQCARGQTVMTSFPGINKHNGLLEPSACDRETVRRVYEQRITGTDRASGLRVVLTSPQLKSHTRSQ